MSKAKDAFRAGLDAYNDKRYVYKPPKYDGPLEVQLTLEEAEYYKHLSTPGEPVILNDDWDKLLNIKKKETNE